ncbi:MAG: LPS export ABC transporter periplasmic protein LptC [Synechococcales cyanobacterium CRU_2_2]|nr:LPS export ABC transporter periplasmic protein LptC [Synechococcales cyanobacterium CRU_2_2]
MSRGLICQGSMRQGSMRRCQPLALLWVLLLVSGSGCARFRKPPPAPPKTASDALVFNDVTLEQADEAGKRLWTLRARQATYSASGKQAKMTQPQGKLFNGQQELYEVEAAEGEVNQDGEAVFLRQQVVVQDLRDGATIRADEAEWRPKESVLILRGNLIGNQADAEVRASEGAWQDQTNQVLLTGAPVKMSLGKQRLKLETEVLTWDIAQEQVVSDPGELGKADRALQIQQFSEKKSTQVIRTAKSGRGEVDLKTQEVVLRNNARLNFVEPPLDIVSDGLRWQTQTDRVKSEARVTVTDRVEKVTIAGDRGDADLAQEVVEFTGNVRGVAELRQSRIRADRLKWFSATQDVEAQGNVTYAQVQPPLEVSGPKAVGNLNAEQVRMTGGNVKTTVIPLDN